MGASKSAYFNAQQNESAEFFKALGHPARIAILEHILKSNSCICNDLVEVLPLSQATISQHLRELKNANIIKGTIEGNSICYCLNEEVLKNMKGILELFLNTSKNIENKCC